MVLYFEAGSSYCQSPAFMPIKLTLKQAHFCLSYSFFKYWSKMSPAMYYYSTYYCFLSEEKGKVLHSLRKKKTCSSSFISQLLLLKFQYMWPNPKVLKSSSFDVNSKHWQTPKMLETWTPTSHFLSKPDKLNPISCSLQQLSVFLLQSMTDVSQSAATVLHIILVC